MNWLPQNISSHVKHSVIFSTDKTAIIEILLCNVTSIVNIRRGIRDSLAAIYHFTVRVNSASKKTMPVVDVFHVPVKCILHFLELRGNFV